MDAVVGATGAILRDRNETPADRLPPALREEGTRCRASLVWHALLRPPALLAPANLDSSSRSALYWKHFRRLADILWAAVFHISHIVRDYDEVNVNSGNRRGLFKPSSTARRFPMRFTDAEFRDVRRLLSCRRALLRSRPAAEAFTISVRRFLTAPQQTSHHGAKINLPPRPACFSRRRPLRAAWASFRGVNLLA